MIRRIAGRPGHWSVVRWFIFCALAFGLSLFSRSLSTGGAAQSNQDVSLLEPGRPIERDLGGGQAHTYRVKLVTDQFLRIVIEQRGIDVAVTLSGSDGKAATQMDRADGTHGTESVVWLADTAQEYQVEVRALNQAAAGRYKISVSDWRVATAQDRQRLAAQQAFVTAKQLHAQATGESLRQSIGQYETALAIWREVGDRAEAAAALTNIGSAYFALSEPDKAVAFFTESLALRRAVGDHTGEADTLNRMGLNYLRLDDYQRALGHLRQSLEIRRTLGDIKQQASLLNNIGGVHQELGESQTARDYYHQSLIPRRAAGDRDGEATTLNNLGGVAHDLGEIQSALNYYTQALEIRREKKNPFGEAQTLNNIGAVYQGSGDQQKALLNYHRALPIWEALGNKRDQASTLNNIGVVYDSLGEPRRGLDYYQRALALRREAKDRRGEADTLTNLGALHRDLNEPKQALEYLGQALQIRRTAQDRLGEALTLGNIGRIYVSTSEWQMALENFLQSLQISRAIGHPRSEGTTLSYLAHVHAAMGETQKALDQYTLALKIHQDIENRNSEASVRHAMARLERKGGNLEAARRHLEAALDLTESLRTKIASQQLRASFFATVQRYYNSYIDLLMHLHQQQPAEGHGALALQISERSRARSLLETLTEAKAYIRRGVDEKLLERERSLLRVMSDKMNRQLRLLGAKHAAERAAITKEVENLTTQYLETEEQIRATSPRYAAITQPRPRTLKEIQQQVLDSDTLLLEYALGEERSFLWAVTPTSFKSFELPKGAVIEETAKQVYKLLTARTETVKGEDAAQREARVAQADAEFPAAVAKLSRMVLAPAAAELGSKRLVVVSDGALQFIPFAVLPDPEGGGVREEGSRREGERDHPITPSPPNPHSYRPLIVKHEIVSLPSASTLAVLRSELAGRTPAPKLAAVLADPVFEATDDRVRRSASAAQTASQDEPKDPRSNETGGGSIEQMTNTRAIDEFFSEGIPRLSNSQREAITIGALAPEAQRKIALGFDASCVTASSEEMSQYRIIHFGTHGLVNSQHSELSGILLSLVDQQGRPLEKGFLRLGEVYNLNLPAELVVLSACQTALGKEVRGEGLMGLTRGFMYAGAARVMASLWKVDDAATSALMEHFYQGLLGPKRLSPAEALRQAQIAMWRNAGRNLTTGQSKDWGKPYFWGGFIMQGEWKETSRERMR